MTYEEPPPPPRYYPTPPPWAPPPYAAPPPPPPAKQKLLPYLAIAVVLLLVVGVAALFILRDRDDGPPHPKEWDSRVLDVVQFVEKSRGLTFKHPVFVDFLDAQAYSDRARTDQSKLTDKEKQQLEAFNGELRALALSNSDIDLLKATNDLVDTGTLAFYDPDTERVSIRGTDVTVALKVTLSHEFTHVLQDQYFNVKSSRTKKFTTDQQSTSFRTMLEGDATRVENQYIDSLSADDKAQYNDSHKKEVDNAVAGLSNVPIALQAFQSVPYLVGPPLTELLVSDGGQAELDAAFKDPPQTDEQVIDPRVFLRHEKPLDVQAPAMPDGVTKDDVVDDGDFGAMTWFVVLSERIDPFVAEKAIAGWGGDAFLAYKQNGKTCVRVDFRGDTATDDSEMQSALDQWIATLPAGMATATTEGETVHFQTCDPGTNAGLTLNNRANDVVQILAARSEFMLQGVRDGKATVDNAFDFADCVVAGIGFDNFVAADKNDGSVDIQQVVIDAIGKCRDKLR
jgi:hypothetical protein